MADGSQHGFNFPRQTARSELRPGEIVVDLFAGGGGASHALETALARAVDIAINHNEWAVALHAANHPLTRHLCQDVWEADPRAECRGQPVGWLHASPDCTHFSQAKGGQPRSRATRSLSWVVLRWAGAVRPRLISLENVKEILKWGPLVAKRDKATGRILTLDMIADPVTGKPVHRVADRGERVPIERQYLVPDKRNEGRTWRRFVSALQRMGYTVEWRRVRACDHGAGTSRERLFLIARRDGLPIRWPESTHGPGRAQPFVTAADCIDWSLPCPSIFTRARPLADATMKRIARGLRRYVLDAAEPYIVGVGGRMGQTAERPTTEPAQTITAKADSAVCVPTLVQCANASANGVGDGAAPLGTITAQPRGGSHALAAPVLVQTGYGERPGQAPRSLDLAQPLGVAVAGGVKHAVAEAALAPALVKFRAGSDGSAADEPMPTITSGAGAARPAGAAHALGVMCAHLTAMAQNVPGVDPKKPLPTILAGATRYGAVAAHLEQANGGFYDGAGVDLRRPNPTICANGSYQRLVTANMVTLRNNCDGAGVDEPVRTITAGAEHHAVVEYTLSPEQEAGALRVAAFLMRYYGEGGQHGDLRDPAATITTKDRLALVTVLIRGTPYVIVDIGLRMLQPHELFRAQGFPADYIIDRTADGRRVSNSRAVAMVGNSVSPPPLRAIVRANLEDR
ncbi:DNA cytosine methyltransferase [Lysobacter enzymogenes]|uniref:DNA cytosine methyltransferase n=1 Tax=Lysobacter enzymogenes TaxID=69 RepID=UPI00384E6A2D